MVASKDEAIQIRDVQDLGYAAVCTSTGSALTGSTSYRAPPAITKTRRPSGCGNAASLLLRPRPKLPTHWAPRVGSNATTNPSPPRRSQRWGQAMAGAPYGGKPGRTLNVALTIDVAA